MIDRFLTGRSTLAGVAVLAVVAGAAGCSTETSPAPEVGSDSVTSVDGGTCSDSGKYFAVHEDEKCSEAPGAGGSWVPSPLFAGAPPEFHACTYVWMPAASTPAAPADRAALVDHVQPSIGGSALTPSCGAPGQLAKPGMASILEDPDPTSPVPGGEGGTVGCDVCGFVDEGTAFVVLPPEQVTLGEFAVKLTNGQSKAFKVDLSTGVKATSVPLPALPPGVAYVEGPVTVR
jgi:hypothetical protein